MLREARFISPFALGCNETRSRMARVSQRRIEDTYRRDRTTHEIGPKTSTAPVACTRSPLRVSAPYLPIGTRRARRAIGQSACAWVCEGFAYGPTRPRVDGRVGSTRNDGLG
jgi:hypothetical protein